MNKQIEREINQMMFLNLESGNVHFSYEQEISTFQYIKCADFSKIDTIVDIFVSNKTSRLSSNEDRNLRYLFACCCTLCSKFAIEGGLPFEYTYNVGDCFIKRMDECKGRKEIIELYREMITFYMEKVGQVKHNKAYSPSVQKALAFIFSHIHSPINVEDVCNAAGYTKGYFSKVFKKELGITVAEYIRQEKVRQAQNYLMYYDMSPSDIGNYLGFSTQSHFISCFKRYTGVTPRVFRENCLHDPHRESISKS